MEAPMRDYTYYYTVDHEKKIIRFPPPHGIGSPMSFAAQGRHYMFRGHYGEEYNIAILTKESWEKHIETHEVKVIKKSELKQ